ncbi:LmbE family N-acetylglucosaminyl deacetylase [Rhodopseudomonas rhenobacensis]|uniref:LmbE family N-acetylglucosaminyl deacetylase n=1 Tax=Rhodopseudomonas rhenobacensis TaxID=87461 RepID=A0A7W7Z5V1_9BRAD|nr:hypothetical protein [Rhodopseudomonas rhenobacensis]MBB5048541.1 LmbE family N-acetylglucosaminyl deacetylase [Rhodopseudomonas rhenobacensis]
MTAGRNSGDGGSALIAIRRPSLREARDGAEIVFVRLHDRQRVKIFAATCYESWQQWGAPRTLLSQNVELVELWRRGGLHGFSPRAEAGDDA